VELVVLGDRERPHPGAQLVLLVLEDLARQQLEEMPLLPVALASL